MHPVASQGTTASAPSTAVVIIPARYHSTRLPGKALADICGRPMIEHVYRRAQAARSIGLVIVATDDTRIHDAVCAFGGEARMTKSTHPSGTDRLAEVAATLSCGIVVNVQGDEPLIDPATIDGVVAVLRETPDAPMATARAPITDIEHADPNVVKVVVDQVGSALYFSRAPIPYLAEQVEAGVVSKHVGVYAYRRDCLLRLAALAPTPLERVERLEQLRALEHGLRVQTIAIRGKPIGVDTPADLDRVRQILSAGASS